MGIATCEILNANPPDPKFPQTPHLIWAEAKSCIAIVKQIPVGALRARNLACVHHIDQLVLREMDKVAYRIARYLEQEGCYAFQTAAQETVWEMKNASLWFPLHPPCGHRGGPGHLRAGAEPAGP